MSSSSAAVVPSSAAAVAAAAAAAAAAVATTAASRSGGGSSTLARSGSKAFRASAAAAGLELFNAHLGDSDLDGSSSSSSSCVAGNNTSSDEHGLPRADLSASVSEAVRRSRERVGSERTITASVNSASSRDDS